MPAITVDDLTVLPRLREPGLGDQPRPVWQVTHRAAPATRARASRCAARSPASTCSHLDPFIMMDQMGEVEYAPGEAKGTPWHPHRGFETVTYIIDGVFDHQDSHGGGGTITNGDTQWMTAGSGLLHIEAPPEWLVQQGGLFHGIQLWVNLPRDAKMNDPKYQDIRSGEVAAAHLGRRRFAGPRHRRLGRRARRSGLHVHADVAGARHRRARRPPRRCPGTSTSTRSSTCSTAAAPSAPRAGRSTLGQSAVLGAGDYLTITADRQPGEPLAEARRDRGRRPADPRAARLGRTVRDEHQVRGHQAYEDFQRGHFGHIPGQ